MADMSDNELREALVREGFTGSRIHTSRASVFKNEATGDREYFLRLGENNLETIARFLREKDHHG